MKAVIIRSMCVFCDNKSTVRFEPSTLDNPFVEVSNTVYARLKRANAARLYQEEPFIATDVEQQLDKDTKTGGEAEISKKESKEQESIETVVCKNLKVAKASKPSADFTKKA
ncbi:hypothetical protein V3564_00220 [Bartonella sp. B12(2025)]